MSSSRAMAAWIAAMALAACSALDPSGPFPSRVEPGEGRADRPTPVVIHGTGFVPQIRANFDDESRARVSVDFRASVGGRPLADVTYVDNTRLAATVPPGLSVGAHPLEVVDPRGRAGLLAQAFVVRPGADAGEDGPPDDGSVHDGPHPDGPPAGDADASGDTTSVDSKPPATVITVAGTGIPGSVDGPATTTAQLNQPMGIDVLNGMVYVAEFGGHRIRSISTGGAPMVATVAGTGTPGLLNGDATTVAQLNYPKAVVADPSGTLFVADYSNDVIRKISGSSVTTHAGSGTKGWLDGYHDVAQFNYPSGVLLVGGVVYVADTANHCIRAIESNVVSPYAGTPTSGGHQDGLRLNAKFDSPSGLAWSGGVMYVADTGNHRIRAISGGAVTTVAGTGTPGWYDGPALTVARFSLPVAVAAAGGKVYVADQGNHLIRVVDIVADTVSTLCGSSAGFDEGACNTARFNYPSGVALGAAGQLYVSDRDNHRVRLISF